MLYKNVHNFFRGVGVFAQGGGCLPAHPYTLRRQSRLKTIIKAHICTLKSTSLVYSAEEALAETRVEKPKCCFN